MAENSDILERMRGYLERQIAWTEASLDTVRAMDLSVFFEGTVKNKPLDDAMIEALVAWQASIEKRTREFQVEREPLLSAWHAAKNLNVEDRSAMRELADKAEGLVAELSTMCLAVANRVGGHSMRMNDGINALARGRGVLNKFRVYTDDDASFIDKKA